MKITFILGAGFSIPAGFPSGHTLNQKFFASIENKILRHSSGEWSWDEYDSATSNNGRLNYEYLRYSYLLSELVESYQKETYQIFDYEEFYDWMFLKINDLEFIKQECDKVNMRISEKFKLKQDSEHYFKKPTSFVIHTLIEIYNFLISDLLGRIYNFEESRKYYSIFLEWVNNSDSSDIITLNHDILLENLLNDKEINYSDGFSTEGSPLLGDKDNILEIFNNVYKEKIRILKLHGSLNYNLYNVMTVEGVWHKPTGDYYFFKSGYRDKHYAKRIDIDTKEILQNFNHSIVPQFLTGKAKRPIISNHLIYKEVFNHCIESLAVCDKLVIIGYSYRDSHINEIIKNSIDKYDFDIININPSTDFPFRRKYSDDKIYNLSSIEELNELQ